MVAEHKFLRKILTSFQNSTRFSRSHDHQSGKTSVCLKIIPNTLHQRIFRSDNQHIDSVILHEICQRLEIRYLDIYIFSYLCRPGISRSNI